MEIDAFVETSSDVQHQILTFLDAPTIINIFQAFSWGMIKSIGLTANKSPVYQYCKRFMISGVKIPMEIWRQITKYAARKGCLDLLRFAHKHGGKISCDVYEIAIRNRHLNCLIYAFENKAYCGNMLYWSIFFGNIDTLMFAIKNQNQSHFNKLSYPGLAAEMGNLEILKILHENGYELSEFVARKAASNGNLACLKYLVENKCEVNESVMDRAVIHGHLECMKYLHQIECKFSEDVCIHAVRGGGIKCLEYAIDIGGNLNERVCENAAEMNNLEMLILLREKGCPWDGSTLRMALMQNHFSCFKYACDNGCPDDNTLPICELAASRGEFKFLEYAYRSNYRLNTNNIQKFALRCTSQKCMKYIRRVMYI
jgi:hypothetical protein